MPIHSLREPFTHGTLPPMSSGQANLPSILENRAAKLLAEGKVDDAVRVGTTAVATARQLASDDSSATGSLIEALGTLADVHRQLGGTEEAEALYREALQSAIEHKSDLVVLANLRTNLATLLDFSQREADAVPLYEQAIADFESMTPPEDEVAAQLRNNLAMIYKGLGKFALAEQHYLRALETLENRRGRSSESVASVFNNLGSLYYTAGFPDQAKEMHTEALEMRKQLLGDNHPDVAQSYCNLATACHELGENTDAVSHYEQSLRILELHLVNEAASYEAVGQDYLALLSSLGDDRKAAAFQKRMEKALAGI